MHWFVAKNIVMLLAILLGNALSGQAQVIPIDSVPLPKKDLYHKGLLFYVSTPLTIQIGYELGNRNIRNQLVQQDIKETVPFRNMYMFSIGYWNGPWKIHFDVQLPNLLFGQYENEITTNQGIVRLSYLYNATQITGSYMVGKHIRHNNFYFNTSLGITRNFLDIRITNDQSQVDLVNLTLPQGFVALPRIFQNSPYVDLALEFCTPFKRRLNIGESFALGFRYGLRETAWRAEGAQLVNPVADRSSMIYLRANFMLSVNREK
jgi:hypothetical protein